MPTRLRLMWVHTNPAASPQPRRRACPHSISRRPPAPPSSLDGGSCMRHRMHPPDGSTLERESRPGSVGLLSPSVQASGKCVRSRPWRSTRSSTRRTVTYLTCRWRRQSSLSTTRVTCLRAQRRQGAVTASAGVDGSGRSAFAGDSIRPESRGTAAASSAASVPPASPSAPLVWSWRCGG